jgi:hypothetical protein
MTDLALRPQPRWVGEDLHSLPLESKIGALLRFAWMNGLKAKKVSDLLRYDLISRLGVHEHADDKTILKIFRKNTRFDIDDYEEKYAIDALDDYWFCKELRICAVCMEGGYHSFWHQLIPLKVCPIHGCGLTNACQTCGKPLARYGINKDLFDRPYFCCCCNQPFTGVQPFLGNHLEFRESARNIERCFSAYVSWIKQLPESRHVLQQLGVQSREKINELGQWCRPADLLFSLWHIHHPFPVDFPHPPYKEVTLLKWRIRKHPNWSTESRGANENKDILRLANSVYRTTLRQLQAWLMKLNRGVGWTIAIAPDFHKDGLIDLQKGDIRELAYMLLRFQMETAERWGLYTNVRNAELEWPLQARELIPEIRTTRLGWRAFFLGVYAGLLHTLERAKSNRHLSLYSIRMRAEGLVMECSTMCDSLTLCGAVAFPTISGMPMAPFKVSNGLSPPLSKVQSDFPMQLSFPLRR